MNELDAAARRGILLMLGALGCFAADALLSFVPLQGIDLLHIAAEWGGYGLFLVGGVTALRGVNATSKNLLYATMGLIALALALSLLAVLLGRVAGFVSVGNLLEWFLYYGDQVERGLVLLGLAVYYYFLISLDYSEAQFRQGMIGWVAPGRGFIFGFFIAAAGVFQLFLAFYQGTPFFGSLAIAASCALLALGTYNRLPPPESLYLPSQPPAGPITQQPPSAGPDQPPHTNA